MYKISLEPALFSLTLDLLVMHCENLVDFGNLFYCYINVKAPKTAQKWLCHFKQFVLLIAKYCPPILVLNIQKEEE